MYVVVRIKKDYNRIKEKMKNRDSMTSSRMGLENPQQKDGNKFIEVLEVEDGIDINPTVSVKIRSLEVKMEEVLKALLEIEKDKQSNKK